jgi:hypothetical protein
MVDRSKAAEAKAKVEVDVDPQVTDFLGDFDIDEWGDSHEGESSDEDAIIANKIGKLFRSENSADPIRDGCSPENRTRVEQLLKRIDYIKSMPPGSASEALADRGDIVHQVSSGKAKPNKLTVLWNIKQANLLKLKKPDPLNAGGDSGSVDARSLLKDRNKQKKVPSGPPHAGGDSGPEGEVLQTIQPISSGPRTKNERPRDQKTN